jgi:parvulin-like peptidyl-prolyl isomerase
MIQFILITPIGGLLMLDLAPITAEEVFYQIKLLGQLPAMRDAIASRKVIQAAADEVGIDVKSEEIQQAADQFRKENNLQRAEETWNWLQSRGLSVNDFEDMIGLSIIRSKLAENLFNSQIESYFVTHRLDYVKVVIYEVILEDEDVALELFYSLKEKEITFYEVSQNYIEDKELRRKGGYRGHLRRTELKPELASAIFSVTPPQLLNPIITSQGVHLICVEEIVQPDLSPHLKAEILSHLFGEWLKVKINEI